MEQINKKMWYKKWWGIFFLIIFTIISVIGVALGFYTFDNLNNNSEKKEIKEEIVLPKENQESELIIQGENNHWIGSANPLVTIVEFADYNCSQCKNSFTKIREISLKYKKYVKIIHRDYPIFENSLELSMAARCAGEQGLFWLMHDKLFQNQGKFEIDYLNNFASQIGADLVKFDQCLEEQKYLVAIKKDFADGQTLKINGTPTWFINNRKIEGDIPYDFFISIIEKFIK